MPNWCECELDVVGNKKELERLKANVSIINQRSKDEQGDMCLSFNKIVPMPKELEDTISPSREDNQELIKKYGYDNWYDWHVANWGTKWDASNPTISKKTSKSLCYDFDTAWSAPIEILVELSKQYPTLRFTLRYFEGGNGFEGKEVMKNNLVLESLYNNQYRGHRGG